MCRIALMVFLIAYGIFEVPSNYLLKKLRPSVRSAPPKDSQKRVELTLISDGLHS